jgi:hypothetical protein
MGDPIPGRGRSRAAGPVFPPRHTPNQTARRTKRRIVALRITRLWRPHRIAYHLHLSQSTVSKVLTRYRVPLLGHIDVNTGVQVRKVKPVRYERANPGDLVHIDVKKLGRIPDGGNHRTLGRVAGARTKRGARPGHAFLHSAIDDHSRVACLEILKHEKKETAAGFWERANAFHAGLGITVTRVTTDNGSCYPSKLFNYTLGESIAHKYTRPYRPQTN